MKFVKATRHFESWLALRTSVNKKDLVLKHERMKGDIFSFFRATYYRWAQLWPDICPDLANAPKVLAVGDLHIENFGTWRDVEGRLVWGVNDFDEAWLMSFPIDLVRLAASARLAIEAGKLASKEQDICGSLLQGYRTSLTDGGCAFVLGENHPWLRTIAQSALRDPVIFWKKMEALPTLKAAPPISAVDAIESLMPATKIPYRMVNRTAGLGSLGHARYVALADWSGGRIAREAKALVPSSACWADCANDRKKTGPAEILYQTIIHRAVRCPDPFVRLRGHWIARRLAPDCSRIELDSLAGPNVELRLLEAMGYEAGNIHLGTPAERKSILTFIRKQKPDWLHQAVEAMLEVVRADWVVWKKKSYV